MRTSLFELFSKFFKNVDFDLELEKWAYAYLLQYIQTQYTIKLIRNKQLGTRQIVFVISWVHYNRVALLMHKFEKY